MSYLNFLKRNKLHPDNRWIIKRTPLGRIREVKLIFNPQEYKLQNKARQLHNQDDLINQLEFDKKKEKLQRQFHI
tara:strand:- start:1118 stop:1342 length:225 start_codon:yes stop_codon:yes gene_type:complete